MHGGVGQINRFIFASSPDIVMRDELEMAGSDVLIGGHCGRPWGQKAGNRTWLNAGVIGLPANDGTQDGWCLLLIPEGDSIRCCWQRLR